jgi:excisionase family DNA binding protein
MAGEVTLPIYMTVAEVAKEFRISKDTLYRWVREGECPGATKVANSIRIHREVFNEWAQGGNSGTGAGA